MFAPKYAYKSIMRRKQKNLTIILAIGLGVALYVGVQMGNTGLYNTVARLQYDQIHNTDFVIRPEGGNYIPENLTVLVKSVPSYNMVSGMERRIEFSTGAFYESTSQVEDNVLVTGIDPTEDTNNAFDTFRDTDGKDIDVTTILDKDLPIVIASAELEEELDLSGSGTEEVMISFDVGNGTFISINVIVDTIFDETKGRGTEGTFASDPISHIYIHIDYLKSLTIPLLKDQVSYIAIALNTVDRSIESINYNTGYFDGSNDIKTIVDEIKEKLKVEGIEGVQVYSQRIDIAVHVQENMGVAGVLTLFVYILNSIALLLIVNVQIMSVEDRKAQTAVLRALGSDRWSIAGVFLLEASVVGVLGGLVGVALGIPLSKQLVNYIADIFEVPRTNTPIDPAVIIPAMIMGLILSIITAVGPAIQSTREVVANALRGIEAPKKPRKGYFTVGFGVLFTVIGISSAANVGKFWTQDGWGTFEDVQAILVGLGLTLAGIGMLLTLVINRRTALNISGISLWGLAIFVLLVAIKWAESGDAGNVMIFLMFYCIIGATLLISQNYEYIMKALAKFLFLFPKLRPIALVTTSGMIGRKTRGVLVFTIFSIILTLSIFVISTAESIRIGLVDEHDWRSDGIDVVVDVQSPVAGIAGNISEIDTVTHVFAFRRAMVPFYTLDISVSDIQYDAVETQGFIPVIEFDESIINPNNNWDDNSYKLSLMRAWTDGEGAVLDSFQGVGAEKVQNLKDSEKVFQQFFDHKTRDISRTYTLNNGNPTSVDEKQTMVFGSRFVVFLGLELGGSLYMQTKDGEMSSMYIGATGFDMLGMGILFGLGVLVTPEIAATLPAFDQVKKPNLYLVRSTNEFNDEDANDVLATAIESKLNKISTFGILLGANTRIVKEEVVEWGFQEAAFWDFLGLFSSLGLVIGSIGMAIIAIRSVSERIREIGMMRSIGFSRKSVIQGVIIELVVLSVLGLIVGIINGVLFTIAIVSNLFETTESYPVMAILYYVIGLIFIAIIAGVIPGYRASRVTPSQALRYTG